MVTLKKIERRTAIISLIILVIFTIVVVFTPFAIKYYLNNHVFANMENYEGHVSDVDTSLLRGYYILKDIKIERKKAEKSAPFFKADMLKIWLSWEALIRGEILAEASLSSSKLNFVQSQDDTRRQHGEGPNWIEVFDNILPATLHRLTIIDSEVHFNNPDTTPPIKLDAKDINAYVTNLTNVKNIQGERIASGRLTAKAINGADILVQAEFDPFDYNDFIFAASVKNLNLTNVNSLVNNLINVDFKSGKGDIFCEITAENSKLNGYIKPLMSDVNVASWQQDVEKQDDSIPRFIWEGTIGVLQSLLKNQSSEKVATQIEISGDLKTAKVDSWGALLGFIKNAFVEALSSQFKGITQLIEDDKKEEKKEKKEKKE